MAIDIWSWNCCIQCFITGLFGYPGGSAYVSTKFAIEGLSESISYELGQFGIKVVLIEPGFIKTNFSNAMVIAKKAQDQNSPYSQMMQRIQANSGEMVKNASPVDIVSKAILEAVTSKSPSLRYWVKMYKHGLQIRKP
jgi:NAD(P)-dependent dehydrogenase (short-subunit alcohol dehydrogenase family)